MLTGDGRMRSVTKEEWKLKCTKPLTLSLRGKTEGKQQRNGRRSSLAVRIGGTGISARAYVSDSDHKDSGCGIKEDGMSGTTKEF